jgi:hypothetical protein
MVGAVTNTVNSYTLYPPIQNMQVQLWGQVQAASMHHAKDR